MRKPIQDNRQTLRMKVEHDRQERLKVVNESVDHEIRMMRQLHVKLVARANKEAQEALSLIDNLTLDGE